ncbi:MAG: hypothetical protein NTW78_03865 [Campylobacterales bacterium]|nr:hypothetical protein [Campylobacterales bacterium]
MKIAIMSENLQYSKFYRTFKECWGRLSINYFGDSWNDLMAKKNINGVEVFGNERIILFSDASVNFKYTKLFCKTIGADYDYLVSNFDNVSYFYVDLSGVKNSLDFSNTTVVQNAMQNIQNSITPYGVDSIALSLIVDAKHDGVSISNLSLAQLRQLKPNIDVDTADYISSDIGSYAPTLKFTALPTNKEIRTYTYITHLVDTHTVDADGNPVFIKENVLDADGKPIIDTTTITYEQVDGIEVGIGNENLHAVFKTLGVYTNYLDACFNSITLEILPLPDRVEQNYVWDEIGGGMQDVIYKRYQYIIHFNFGSQWDYTPNPVTLLITPLLINKINYAYLSSSAFASTFASQYAGVKASYAAARENEAFQGMVGGSIIPIEPTREMLIFTSLVTYLGSFSAVHDIFYTTGNSSLFAKFQKSYLKYNVAVSMPKKAFSDLLFMSVYLGSEAKKSGGWLGGSLLGQLLEAVFIVVIVAAGIIFSILFWNPLPIALTMAALTVTSKYGGMSIQGQMFAGLGTQALTLAGIIVGISQVYDIAYESAWDVTYIANGEGATGWAAAEQIGFSETISNISFSSFLKLAGSLNSIYSLLNAPIPPDLLSQDTSNIVTKDKAIYAMNSSYSFYNEVYKVYEY